MQLQNRSLMYTNCYCFLIATVTKRWHSSLQNRSLNTPIVMIFWWQWCKTVGVVNFRNRSLRHIKDYGFRKVLPVHTQNRCLKNRQCLRLPRFENHCHSKKQQFFDVRQQFVGVAVDKKCCSGRQVVKRKPQNSVLFSLLSMCCRRDFCVPLPLALVCCCCVSFLLLDGEDEQYRAFEPIWQLERM